MTEFLIQSIAIPYLVATLVGKIMLRKDRKRQDDEQKAEKIIKGLVSTEKHGDWITVCFQLQNGSFRNFKVKWYDMHYSPGFPSEVVNLETFQLEYTSPFHGAAHHAAEIHMGTYGKPSKSVYENPDKWLN